MDHPCPFLHSSRIEQNNQQHNKLQCLNFWIPSWIPAQQRNHANLMATVVRKLQMLSSIQRDSISKWYNVQKASFTPRYRWTEAERTIQHIRLSKYLIPTNLTCKPATTALKTQFLSKKNTTTKHYKFFGIQYPCAPVKHMTSGLNSYNQQCLNYRLTYTLH